MATSLILQHYPACALQPLRMLLPIAPASPAQDCGSIKRKLVKHVRQHTSSTQQLLNAFAHPQQNISTKIKIAFPAIAPQFGLLKIRLALAAKMEQCSITLLVAAIVLQVQLIKMPTELA